MSDGRQIHGQVLRVVPSAESAFYVTAVMRFTNHTPDIAQVQAYRLVWLGGAVEVQPKELQLPPDGTREWSIRLTPVQGEIAALMDKPSTARIEVIQARFKTSPSVARQA